MGTGDFVEFWENELEQVHENRKDAFTDKDKKVYGTYPELAILTEIGEAWADKAKHFLEVERFWPEDDNTEKVMAGMKFLATIKLMELLDGFLPLSAPPPTDSEWLLGPNVHFSDVYKEGGEEVTKKSDTRKA